VRVSSNRRVLVGAISVDDARDVLRALRALGEHQFLANDVSLTDADVPPVAGHRQVTDALLLVVARRAGVPLVTFDASLAAVGGESVLLRR
jgi:predicted nucleic acid-binding protein